MEREAKLGCLSQADMEVSHTMADSFMVGRGALEKERESQCQGKHAYNRDRKKKGKDLHFSG